MPAELAGLLDRRIDELLVQTGAPAITAAVALPGLGSWTATRGLARVAPEQAAAGKTWFYWASVSKILTAVLVLQLVEEGKLHLEDRLARWYPEMPNAGLITLEQLLTHTSGLATNAAPESPGPTTPAAAVAAPAIFCPGVVASYSNAGYELLAAIVQSVERRPFDEVLRQRIAEPLGLRRLRALRPAEWQVEDMATPHLLRQPASDPDAWSRMGSGNVIASAQDMLAVWRGVLTGQLLRPATVARQWALLYPIMEDSTAMRNTAHTWFGQGVMLMEWTDGHSVEHRWLGHLGGTPGANATVAYDAPSGVYVATAVNSGVSAAAVANAMLDVVAAWRASTRLPGAGNR